MSQTEFVMLLDLMSRADLEQRIDADEFVNMKPNAQALVLKLAKNSTLAYKLTGGTPLVDTPTHDEQGQKKKRAGKKPKPLQILAPKDCNLNEPIDFSIEKYDKWLQQKGFKSAKTYSEGVRGMLRAHGMQTMTGITILSLKTLRDAYVIKNVSDMNKRTWLKKFNEYIIWE
ncbi:MAG: hypothetical protein ACC656_05115, partial [Candidatus Heimdallarchaeota archaeon]